ncbi:cell division protein FtsQ/DivIB [Lactococcus insecticola]|uniref:Cell division protein DivIB n=1 Tax=Pseudolactococcus insecticola TaxID=2709158 RepID=A0A6A0B8A1_9LACT|nr:cell division protein FtsQ/DivIB [Lactococcus insecticola]GFH40688.1 cell division protein DivIB [Lactococcus insecticola]
MADKENPSEELTPWQKQHAAFEKKKAAESAKKQRESRQKKPEKTASVIEKYDAEPIKTPEVAQKSKPFFERFKVGSSSDKTAAERNAVSDVFGKIWPFLTVAGLIFLGSLYEASSLSKIGSFTAEGNAHETSKQVANATGIKTNDTVWSIVKKEPQISAQIVKAFPRIKTATIALGLPNHFTAKITEYSNSAYLKVGSNYQIVLSNGRVLSDEKVDAAKLAALPVLNDFSAKEVATFVRAYESLKPAIKSEIVSASKSPTDVTKDFISIEMKDGNQVRVPLSQMSEKMPYYTSVAKSLSEPSVVDMEAGIYAKSKAAYQKDLDDEAEKESESKSAAASSKEAAKAKKDGESSDDSTDTTTEQSDDAATTTTSDGADTADTTATPEGQ